jgi:D-alanyl-D-alanine dipeptidase
VAKLGTPEPIAALNRIKMLELAHPWQEREPLVDIRTYCPDIVPVERICPYLRRTAADMLNHAQSSLPQGYRLKVGTALRTLAMQKGGWDRFHERMRQEHPDWPLSALRRATNKYFAPYDQKAPPGHCTGGAVDVGLLDPNGKDVDLIAPTKGWEAAYTWSDKISPEAKANRMLMVEAMLGAGYSNCRDEYWHYSYGDSAWAVRVGESECPYGWAHPPVALETDYPDASAHDLHIETERDFNGYALSATGALAFPAADAAPAGPRLSVGLYWANGVPVTLELSLPPSLRSGEEPTLYIGDGKEQWERIAMVERRNRTLHIHVSPAHDRAIITTHLPPPPESAPAQ